MATAGGGATLFAILTLAAIVRFARWPTPTALVLNNQSYDPQVMYVASASFLHGLMPYRDFTFLHPPGVLLGLSPSVLVGSLFGDAFGLASARVGVVLLGVLNAALVATLLRRFGVQAMLLGGGLYAGWSALAHTEQEVLLEPFLVTALLVSLHLFRSSHRWAPLGMGAILGIATMVKVWAAVDLIFFATVFLLLQRFVDLARFTLGAAIGGISVGFPFFASAPARMWEMVVTAQMGRPNAEVGLLARAGMFGPVESLTHPAYRVVMALLLTVLLVMGVLLVGRGWIHRAHSAEAVEAGVWAGVALVHTLLLSVSGSFYDHYAMFAAAPLTLVVGAAWGWAREQINLDRRSVTAALTAIVLLVAATSVAMSVYRVTKMNTISWEQRAQMIAWIDDSGCTWASLSDRVLIDEVVNALRRGCTMSVDPYGEGLLAHARGQADWQDAGRASESAHISQAKGLVLPADEERWAFLEQQSAQIKSDFVVAKEVGDRILWVRK